MQPLFWVGGPGKGMGEEGYWEALSSCSLGIGTASLVQSQLISLLQQHVLTLQHHSKHCPSCTERVDIATTEARAVSTPSQFWCFQIPWNFQQLKWRQALCFSRKREGNIKQHWTGATNNVTNLFCIHMDTVYTYVILHAGLILAVSGTRFFPFSPHISIPPLYRALSARPSVKSQHRPGRTFRPPVTPHNFCSTTHAALRWVTPPQNCCFQVTRWAPVGPWVQVDWRRTLTEWDAAFENLRNGNTRF